MCASRVIETEYAKENRGKERSSLHDLGGETGKRKRIKGDRTPENPPLKKTMKRTRIGVKNFMGRNLNKHASDFLVVRTREQYKT